MKAIGILVFIFTLALMATSSVHAIKVEDIKDGLDASKELSDAVQTLECIQDSSLLPTGETNYGYSIRSSCEGTKTTRQILQSTTLPEAITAAIKDLKQRKATLEVE
jgi:hypothetical protein